MTFKIHSETCEKAKKEFKINFGLRSWSRLAQEEKITIWRLLIEFLFPEELVEEMRDYRGNTIGYNFKHHMPSPNKDRIFVTIIQLTEHHKAKNYAPNSLQYPDVEAAYFFDFHHIFFTQSENVALELLSIYARFIINEESIGQFNKFADRLNEIFSDFRIDKKLTHLGFIPKQEELIDKHIYTPLLEILAHEQWAPVNRELEDAFKKFREKNFSSSITHTISAIQAFLQIKVYKKTGEGDISKLIKIAQNKNLIPKDSFSTNIFKQINSFFAQERKRTGDAHPKEEYATEADAQLVLNLALVFLQHCI